MISADKPNGVNKATSSNNSNGTHIDALNRIKKDEFLRLVLQSLQDLGYNNVAEQLQKDAGIELEPKTVLEFRQAIINGDFRLAEELVLTLPLIEKDVSKNKILFLIRQQQFLELLEAKDTMKALKVLRQELTPVSQNVDQLHRLSSLILCSSVDEVKLRAKWDGANGSSRNQLLYELETFVDPSVMIRKNRMNTLLYQSFEWQRRECLYHFGSNDYSLFSDHKCDRNLLPTATTHILKEHKNEVWHISFSFDGKKMASVSKDSTCIIWEVETFKVLHVLRTSCPATYSGWSFDSTKLLTCGNDSNIRLWNVITGELIETFREHTDQVTCCVWLPDNEHFISGACDMTMIIRNIDGTLIKKIDSPRILDMKMTEDGKRIAAVGYDKSIVIYDVDGLQLKESCQFQESCSIGAVALSRDGKYVLTSINIRNELHLWNVEDKSVCSKYEGYHQGEYVIRSSFGGPEETFILSGSDDNGIYVWNRDNQTLLEVLEGHQGRVNCVSWYPGNPMMFASASDDHTIRM
ncbi:unnamed protein product [Cunninghamella blakesleeana]